MVDLELAFIRRALRRRGVIKCPLCLCCGLDCWLCETECVIPDPDAGDAEPVAGDVVGPETLPDLFARARSLLGQQVRVTIDQGPTITAGKFLAVSDDGTFVIEDNIDGSVRYCWPMLHIEAESVGARIKREGEDARRVVLDELGAERAATCVHCHRTTTRWEEAPSGQGGQVAGPWCWACLTAFDLGWTGAATARFDRVWAALEETPLRDRPKGDDGQASEASVPTEPEGRSAGVLEGDPDGDEDRDAQGPVAGADEAPASRAMGPVVDD